MDWWNNTVIDPNYGKVNCQLVSEQHRVYGRNRLERIFNLG